MKVFTTAVALGSGIALVLLKYVPKPWVWVFLAGAIVLGCAAVCARHRRWRVVCVNGALFLAALAAIEGGLMFVSWRASRDEAVKSIERGSIKERYWRTDEILGYAPLPDLAATSIKWHGEDLVYDVVYTIDSNGLRVAPPVSAKEPRPAVLFFGGSFTYGEGVQDHETLPYQVGLLSDGAFATFNFGFHGYGPHQMLAALEQGLVTKIVANRVAYVIYQGLAAHVARSAGLSEWDEHGPRYRLNRAGDVFLAGRFDDPVNPVLERMSWQIKKSFLGRRLMPRNRRVTRRDERLFIAIVAEARDHVAKLWPDAEFHVIFWDNSREAERIMEALGRRNIIVHRVTSLLGNMDEQTELYKIRLDGHPTALAYRKMAEYVVGSILQERPRD